MNQLWKKSPFIQSKAHTGTEGRKLNLSERILISKPDFIFYKYAKKSDY